MNLWRDLITIKFHDCNENPHKHYQIISNENLLFYSMLLK